MTLRQSLVSGASFAALIASALPNVGLAQAAPSAATEETSGKIEDIVVTAERRETRLQETPISITALSGAALQERGAQDIRAIADATPNLQITTSGNGSGGANFAQVFIRGVGQPDFIITKDPAVGIYVDGVYFARAPGSVLELLDVARVETLRGPQGTLFGKNTEGGAINVVTNIPRGDTSGLAEIRFGNFHRIDVSGTFETALVPDKLAIRISAQSRNRDGFYKRLIPTGVDDKSAAGNSVNAQTIRATLAWTISPSAEFILQGDYTRQRQTAGDYQLVQSFPTTANIELYNRVVASRQGLTYNDRYIAPRPWTTYSTTPSYNNGDIYGVAGTLNLDLGGAKLKSITAYRGFRVTTRTDGDGTPVNLVASDGQLIRQHQFSQELQLSGKAIDGRLDWLLGGYYFTEHAFNSDGSNQLVGLFAALEAAPLRSISPGNVSAATCPANGTGPATCLGGAGNTRNVPFDVSRQQERFLDGKSYAAFAHVNFAITDQLFVEAGARMSRDTKAFRITEFRPLRNIQTINASDERGYDIFTPKLGLRYQFSPDAMIYVGYSKGFKAGGVNGRTPLANDLLPFGPESVEAYEAGAKLDLFDNRLRINVAAFHSKYRDLQVTRNTVDANGAFLRLETNGGDARINGFEAELTARPTDALELGGTLGYTDFRFTSLLPQTPRAGTVLLTLDSKLPFIPKWNGSVYARYVIPVAQGNLSLRADLHFSGQYFVDIENNLQGRQKPVTTLDARIAYAPESKGWEVFIQGTNLTNRAVIANGQISAAAGLATVTYREPRMVSGGVRIRF